MASKVQYPKTSGGSLAERERRRKTVQITMDGGGVQVAAPMTTPEDELRAIVRRRAPWILRQAAGEMPRVFALSSRGLQASWSRGVAGSANPVRRPQIWRTPETSQSTTAVSRFACKLVRGRILPLAPDKAKAHAARAEGKKVTSLRG